MPACAGGGAHVANTPSTTIPGLIDVLPAAAKRVERPCASHPTRASPPPAHILTDWRFDPIWSAPAVAPTIPQPCSDEFMVACAQLAAAQGVGLQRTCGVQAHVIVGLTKYGKTPPLICMTSASLAPIRRRPRSGVDDDDIQRLSTTARPWLTIPSNMRWATASPPVKTCWIGSSTSSSAPTGQPKPARQPDCTSSSPARYVSKGKGRTRTLAVPREYSSSATPAVPARRVRSTDPVRSPGLKQADLVFLDLTHINWIPCNDPTNAGPTDAAAPSTRHGRRPMVVGEPPARRPSILQPC